MGVSLTCFDRAGVAPVLDHPKAERLVAGHPLRKTYTHYANADGAVDAGSRECEPGAWRIDFADKRDEFFHVLQGRIRITAESGEARVRPRHALPDPGRLQGIVRSAGAGAQDLCDD